MCHWSELHAYCSPSLMSKSASFFEMYFTIIYIYIYTHTTSLVCFAPRYGLGEGFSNEQKSRVQKASVKFQQRAYVSLHENVPAFEEETPQYAALIHHQCFPKQDDSKPHFCIVLYVQFSGVSSYESSRPRDMQAHALASAILSIYLHHLQSFGSSNDLHWMPRPTRRCSGTPTTDSGHGESAIILHTVHGLPSGV